MFIDDYCWVGQRTVIIPGVRLGKRTIVGAISVVTKSFPDGYCVIAGNPAKVIKYIDREEFIEFGSSYRYIPEKKFKERSIKQLNI